MIAEAAQAICLSQRMASASYATMVGPIELRLELNSRLKALLQHFSQQFGTF